MIRNRLFSFILLVAIFLNIAKYQIPVLEYSLFKSYIARNLCIKKDVKGNCCQGKCFLKKQLNNVQEQEAHETDTSGKKVQKSLDIYEYIGARRITLELLPSYHVSTFKTIQLLFYNLFYNVFTPPKLLQVM